VTADRPKGDVAVICGAAAKARSIMETRKFQFIESLSRGQIGKLLKKFLYLAFRKLE
jgi:hypothetical protein